MKRIWAVVIIALVIAGLCVFDSVYTNQTVESLCDELQACIELAKSGPMEQVPERLETMAAHWERARAVIMLFVEQDLLDEVDDQMEHMKALAVYHTEEFIPTAVLCAAKLREIQKRETLSLASWV